MHRPRHERRDVLPITRGRQPITLAPAPLLLADSVPFRGDVDVPEEPDPTVERPVGQAKLEVHPRFAEDAVPLANSDLDVGDEVVAQPLVEHVEGGCLVHREAVASVLSRAQQGVHGGIEPVIVVNPSFAIAPLEPHGVPVRGVGGQLRPEEVEGHRMVEVEVLLKRLEIDDPEGPRIRIRRLAEHFRGPLHHPRQAGFAHVHVVGLFLEHESAGAREGVEARILQSGELELPVPVREVGEHEEGEPVGRRLVEGTEDAGPVHVAGAPLEEGVRLVASVPAEVRVQQVDHCPEVAALLDVDLQQGAEIVERGTGRAEVALLLDGGGLGVPLHRNDAPERPPVLPGNFLPHRLPLAVPEPDDPVSGGRGQENTPAVVRHLHVVVVGPAAGVDVDGGAQVHVARLESDRTGFPPPVDVGRLPCLQGPPQAPVVAELHVVGNALVEIDARHVQTLRRSKSAPRPVP